MRRNLYTFKSNTLPRWMIMLNTETEPCLEFNFDEERRQKELITQLNCIAELSSSGHEVRPINDLFRPHDCIRSVVPLMVIQVFLFR